MIQVNVTEVAGGGTRRNYENLVAVGAIGKDSPSKRSINSDIASNQLVHFFLRAFFKVHPKLLPKLPGGQTEFPLSADVRTQTIEGIGRFQAFALKLNFPLFQDSRVSVPLGKFVPGTRTRWTIHALNSFYISLSGNTDHNTLFANKTIQSQAPVLAAELLAKEPLPDFRK
jgi:hypothetical protein